jgi:hypothetical protein
VKASRVLPSSLDARVRRAFRERPNLPKLGSGGNDILTLRPYPWPMALSDGFNFCAPTLFPADNI